MQLMSATECDRDTLAEVASELFGHDSLRAGQAEVIADVFAGRPVVTVMPTGAGKSLCYQLPAVLLGREGGVTLVVSPLIALMKDQVDSLHARGIRAAALTSAASHVEQSAILEGIREGAYTLVYVAPERFRSPRFVSALAQIGDRLALLAVDEAHCISEWGHEFRPDYRRLGEVVTQLRPRRLIALTATATPEVRADIAVQLEMVEPRFHVRGFDRPNLHYAVVRAGGAVDKCRLLVDKVRMRSGGVALVYAATRKNAEKYAVALGETGMRVRVYHAGLSDDDRHGAQDEFMSGKLDVVVATNAFGMGVDKANIRLVIHADLPRSPEAYYQEAGRGGRDGIATDCVLLFNHSDARLQEFLIAASYPSAELLRAVWKLLRESPQIGPDPDALRAYLPDKPHASTVRSAIRILVRAGYLREEGQYVVATKPDPAVSPKLDLDGLARRAEVERSKLKCMVDYAYHPRCRRQYVLAYFGDVDWADPARQCVGCDNCKGAGQARALDDEQREHVAGLLALVAALHGRFGRTRIANLANATDDDERFAELPERGIVRGQTSKYLMDLLRSLEGAGLIVPSPGEYPTLSITHMGERVLAGRADVDGIGVLMPETKRKKAKRVTKPVAVTWDEGDMDMALVERLRALRTELAAAGHVPAYVVFTNGILEQLALQRPTSLAELANIKGIGPSRIEKYGSQILGAIEG